MDELSELLSQCIEVLKSSNNLGLCLEAIISALDILEGIPPAILSCIKPVVDLIRFEAATINLRYEYNRSSCDLNEIGYNVMELIDILKSLSEMAYDEKRKGMIRTEVSNQIKMGRIHFDRQDIIGFPELNDFLTKLIIKIERARALSKTIEERCKELFTRNEAAETEASKKETIAKFKKYAFIVVAVVGLGFVIKVRESHLIILVAGGFVLFCIILFIVFKQNLHQEEKFRNTKENFKCLNKDARRLLEVTRKSSFPARTMISNNIDSDFIRENAPNQLPSLSHITTSLDTLFVVLECRGMDFHELRGEAENIVKSTEVDFQLSAQTCAGDEYTSARYTHRSGNTPYGKCHISSYEIRSVRRPREY